MIRYPAGDGAPLLIFGHGAGAGESHPWMRRLGEGLASRGIAVVTFNFPYMEAGRRAPDPGGVLEEAFRSVWVAEATAPGAGVPPSGIFAGGKSMGGRISSQAAAAGGLEPAPRGLVFFGYPLHPPGKPAQRRDRHLAQVTAPMLFLHGTRDPFGSPDEMTALVTALGKASLEMIDQGDHSLAVPKSRDPQGRSLDRAMDIAAAWIHGQT